MLGRFEINLSGMSRDFYQDVSLFSNNTEDREADDELMTEDSSNEAPPAARNIVGATEVEEFTDCVEDEDEVYTEDDDADDEESSDDGGKVALAYDSSQLTDLDGPPQNGHDYLRLVERESRALPSVFSAQKPFGRFKEPSESDDKQSETSTLSAESHKDMDDVCTTFYTPARPLPSSSKEKPTKTNNSDEFEDLRFRDDILSSFKRLREKIDAIRETKTVQALHEQEKISETQAKKTMDRSVRQAISLIRLMELGHPPQVSTLITKSQLELHLTLEKLADLYDIAPSSSKTIHTDWIYSLIAALRDPIEPDICATLRRIARICLAKRKMFEEKAKAAAAAAPTAVAQSSSGKDCGGTSFRADPSKNSESINQPTPMSGQHLPSGHSSKSSRKRQAGKAPENNEELVNELEKEEYTSSLLIICIVRYYFGQVDLK